MIKHKDSHLDHALTEAQVNYILEKFADRDSFYIETFELPESLGTAPCGLYGPVMGDAPVIDRDVDDGTGDAFYRPRGDRGYESRLVDRDPRPTRTVTVIAGRHDEHVPEGTPGAVLKYLADATRIYVIEHPCILYTAFGGPLAPKEVGDLKAQIEKVRRDDSLDDVLKAHQLARLEVSLIESMTFWREHALSSLA
jgi:hypothetical protein